MSKDPALAHPHCLRQPPNRPSFQPLGRSNIHGPPQNLPPHRFRRRSFVAHCRFHSTAVLYSTIVLRIACSYYKLSCAHISLWLRKLGKNYEKPCATV